MSTLFELARLALAGAGSFDPKLDADGSLGPKRPEQKAQ